MLVGGGWKDNTLNQDGKEECGQNNLVVWCNVVSTFTHVAGNHIPGTH